MLSCFGFRTRDCCFQFERSIFSSPRYHKKWKSTQSLEDDIRSAIRTLATALGAEDSHREWCQRRGQNRQSRSCASRKVQGGTTVSHPEDGSKEDRSHCIGDRFSTDVPGHLGIRGTMPKKIPTRPETPGASKERTSHGRYPGALRLSTRKIGK